MRELLVLDDLDRLDVDGHARLLGGGRVVSPLDRLPGDLVDDVEGSFLHLAEDRVGGIEPGRLAVLAVVDHHEELAPARVRPTVRHGDGPVAVVLVLDALEFVRDRVAGPIGRLAVPAVRIPGLDDESPYNSVPGQAVEVTLLR